MMIDMRKKNKMGILCFCLFVFISSNFPEKAAKILKTETLGIKKQKLSTLKDFQNQNL